MTSNDKPRSDALLRQPADLQPGAGGAMVIELPPDPVVLADLRQQIQERVGPVLDGQDLAIYQVAITEAVTNAIEAHLRSGSRRPVVVTIDTGERCVTVEDQGGGMAVDAGNQPDDPPPPAAFRGRGLMIMRSICPDLEIVDTEAGSLIRLPYPT